MIKPLSTDSHKPSHRVDRMLQNEAKINSLPSFCFMLGMLSAMSKASMALLFFRRQLDCHITGEVQVWRPLIFPTLHRAAGPLCLLLLSRGALCSSFIVSSPAGFRVGRRKSRWSPRQTEACSAPCSEHGGRCSAHGLVWEPEHLKGLFPGQGIRLLVTVESQTSTAASLLPATS